MSDCAKNFILNQLKALAATITDVNGDPLAIKVMRGSPLANALTDDNLPCLFVVGLDDQLSGAQYFEDESTDWMVGIAYAAKRPQTADRLADVEALDVALFEGEARIHNAVQDAEIRPAKVMRWVKTLTSAQNQSLPLGVIMPVFNAGYLQDANDQYYGIPT